MKAYELDQGSWGVCGFVAAIQAACTNDLKRFTLESTTYETLLPCIEKFCLNNKDIEKELLEFSTIFGQDYSYQRIEDVVSKMKADQSMQEAGIGVAMTANAMSRLCKSLGFKNHDFHGTTPGTSALNLHNFPYKNTIYGLGKTKDKGNFRYGLLHWIYVDEEGRAMTWGEIGSDAVKELSQEYDKITHYIPALV